MIWPSARSWRVLVAVGSFACALLILGVMVYRERALLLSYHWDLNWEFVVYGFFLLAGGMLLAAGVWAGIMRSLGSNVPYQDHLRYYIISQLAKRLPGTVWYVASRGYLYRQHGESARLVALASTLELIISVISGALVAFTLAGGALNQFPGAQWQAGAGWAAMLFMIGAGMAFMHPAVLHWLLRRIGQRDDVLVSYQTLVLWLGAYIVIWIIGGMILLCMVNAVTVVAASDSAFVIGSWCLVGVLSILVLFLPSNLGFTEVGLSLLLANVIPSSVAVIVAILMRVAMLLYELISAGILMAILRMRKSRPREETRALEDEHYS